MLHSCKWDKDKLVELWIEDSDKICTDIGIFCPVRSSKEDNDSSLPSSLFLPFPAEEERRPRVPPRFSSSEYSSSSNPSISLPPFPARAFGGNMRLLDIIRPLLARRIEGNGENDDEENEDEDEDDDDEEVEAATSRARRLVNQLDDV